MRAPPPAKPIVEFDNGFAPTVEWVALTCRRGRELIAAVEHTSGDAIFVTPRDVEEACGPAPIVDGRAALLRELGFVGTAATSTAAGGRRAGDGIVWRSAHTWVRWLHDAWLHRLFRAPWIVTQIVVAVSGALALLLALRGGPPDLRATPAHVPLFIALGFVALAVHELGHALVTVHYGRTVRHVGLRLHLGLPAVYVDSSDALLLSRRERLAQAAAGVWAEWLATSIATFSLLVLPDGDVAVVLQRFVVVNTIGMLTNLLPFAGLDGALILGDLAGEPDLVHRCRDVLYDADARHDRLLVAYAVANVAASALLLASAAFFWWELFGGIVDGLLDLGLAGRAAVALIFGSLGVQILRCRWGAARR